MPLLADPHVDAMIFDFSDVVATIRMALAGEDGDSPYRVDLHDDVVEGIRRLRAAGIRTGLITNNDRRPFEHEAPHVPLKELFDVDVFSSDIGIGKPDRRIFTHTLDLLGIDASRAVFLDDVARNVDAAIGVGMQGVVIDRPATARTVIDEVLEARS